MVTLADIPLRQRKQAQTRLALLDATLARLDGAGTLEEVSVRDVCAEVEVSEASFFNYFPHKTDVIVYFVQLWSLDLAWRVRHQLAGARAFEAIRTVFAATGRQVAERPAVMAEILAYQARTAVRAELPDIPLADRVTAFPDRAGIEDVPAIGLDGLLPPLVKRAVAEGDLPAGTDEQAAYLGLSAIFFGVPIALRRSGPDRVEAAYGQQLDLLWAGLRAAPRSTRRRSRKGRRPS